MTLTTIIALAIVPTAAFFVAFFWAPLLTHFLYRHKCWKKSARTVAPDGTGTPLFNALHKDRETSTPRLGGLLIWVTVGGLALVFWFLDFLFDVEIVEELNFISRSQTWIPIFTLIAASLLGLFDDLLVIKNYGDTKKGGGIRFRHRAVAVAIIGLVGAWWFFGKLGWDTIHLPFWGELILGLWYVPLFVGVMLVSFSGSIIDGLDGLAGGVFSTIFASYAVIAFIQGQYDLAIFAAAIVGTLTAFLWYNIPPARFYLSETGALGLTTTLAVMVFLTDTVFIFPLIAFVLIAEIASNVIQLLAKRFWHRKVFLISPIHHHFEAKGWPPYKVTMRFWLISGVCSGLGLIVFLIDKYFALLS